jgi:enoyl-[acyl-carrier-protein] reductase (NADH)
MGRVGTYSDIGNTVTPLCSERASWITGQTITTNGGASLMDTVLPFDLQRGCGEKFPRFLGTPGS